MTPLSVIAFYVLFSSRVFSQYVDTIAGSGAADFADGVGRKASFNTPIGIAIDAYGNLYIGDRYNHRIRKITPTGDVTTYAGSGIATFADGNGKSAAFSHPFGVTIDKAGNLYVADHNNNRIRRVDLYGTVTTLSGSQYGYLDGDKTKARFSLPVFLTFDQSGNLLVSDHNNHQIRNVSMTGTVTTVGTNNVLTYPHSIVTDSAGNMYVSEPNNHRILQITNGGILTKILGTGVQGLSDAEISNARFNRPYGLACGPDGTLYIADSDNHCIRKVSSNVLDVTTLSSSVVADYFDGDISSARLFYPSGITIDKFGNLYVTEYNGHRVRKITVPENVPQLISPTTWTNFNHKFSISASDKITHLTKDSNGNVILAINTKAENLQLRSLNGQLIYESIHTFPGKQLGIVVKLSPNDNLFWAAQISGGAVGGSRIQSIQTDSFGNAYVTGIHTATATISDAFKKTLTVLPMINSARNGFVAKFAPNGTLVWVVRIQGSPLFLTAKQMNDTLIVVTKFAKESNEHLPIVVIPNQGDRFNVSEVDNGGLIMRISAHGQILWSNQVNFVPWENDDPISVSKSGEIMYTGWCPSACWVYTQNNSTALTGELNNNVAASLVFSPNGTFKTWLRLEKYITFTQRQCFRCSLSLRNTTINMFSFGERVTSLKISETAVVDVVVANDLAFLSLSGKLWYQTGKEEFIESVVTLDSNAIIWKSCGLYDSILGPSNVRGNLTDGTFAFEIEPQYGYITEFPLADDSLLIRLRVNGRFDFRFGISNGTHGYILSIRSGILETTLLQHATVGGRFWGATIDQSTMTLDYSMSFIFVFVLNETQATLFINGQALSQISFLNATVFLLTTSNFIGTVDYMGIMKLSDSYEQWLTVPDTFSGQSITSSVESATLKTFDGVVSTPTSGTESTGTENKVFSIFGISGIVLYVVLGGTSFGFILIVALVVYVCRGRRRNRQHEYVVTYTARNMNTKNEQDNTLINTTSSVFRAPV